MLRLYVSTDVNSDADEHTARTERQRGRRPSRHATPTTACITKPAKVTLIAPANGAVRSNPQVKLKWSDVACETLYHVRVKNTATGKVAFRRTWGRMWEGSRRRRCRTG